MRSYLLTALVAATVTYLLVPLVRRAAVAAGAMTPVRERDVHSEPVPRGGGLAMLGGLAVALLVASRLPLVDEVFRDTSDPEALLSGATLITLLGLADDKWGLDPLTKLAGQCVAAGVMVLQGVQLLWLPLPGETYVLTPVEGTVLTVLVVVVMINAVNFVDGLDGLAAGIMMIAAGAFFVASYQLSVDAGVPRAATPTLATAALVGMCAGFLPHNFHPAKVFMGDTGAMLLGLLFAAAVVSLTGQVEPRDFSAHLLGPAVLPLALPVVVVLVPLLDLGMAVVRRTWAGSSPFAADKRHLHHRLLEIGHSHRRAVLIMYAWSALVAFAVVLLPRTPGVWPKAALAGAVVVALVLTLGVDRGRWVRREPGGRSSRGTRA
ncbi:UDP-GlcNAc:undecaprenyl-phosphate GlcNAc-1-phosphate transferase [Motilibacter rhizosphaerae]|uniref:UDP-GlcNAc:undecaprenyl-phosphate GlcNAc-1-phosphate transferase n=1 Tax=Motilibacter rhizosphaerae TaxID=598652 RepID=A0A4Q7NPB0_9ACTN|nr:MraY family glycosyltransferase [Motilibacter rhizosphaerae]RZS87109.1 UDP-GlcNAc:undecaprenyl-phosphate GlcNAc-1-phosphate transferase [Motilibacter rhizosphaerae]